MNDELLQRVDTLTWAVQMLASRVGQRLSRADVCERLGIHRNTLATYMRERGFPSPGKDGKWLLSEVIEWESKR